MEQYECLVCGYIYDPEVGDRDNGVPPGITFDELPADWLCPSCGSDKDSFSPVD